MGVALITVPAPVFPAMKRFLLFLAVAALGFVIAAVSFALIQPYLAVLPQVVSALLVVATSGWFIAGVVGAILALALLVRWAYSDEW